MYSKKNKFGGLALFFLLIGLSSSVSGSVSVSIDSDKSDYYLGEIVQFTATVDIIDNETSCISSANLTIQDGNSTVCDLPAIYGYYENYGNCNLTINVSETHHDDCVAYSGANLYTYKINWTIPSDWNNDSYTAEMKIIFESAEYSDTTPQFNINVALLQYNLYKKLNSTGVNLISFPLMPSPPMTTAEDACNAIPNLEAITLWDPTNQVYQSGYSCILKSGNFDLAAIGIGYAVSVSGNITWTLNRSVILPTPIDLIKKPGSTGVNLIGLPYNSTVSPFTAEGLCQSIPNLTKNDAVTQWDPINQKYKSGHPCFTGFGNFDLVKGIAYFVSVPANTIWTPV